METSFIMTEPAAVVIRTEERWIELKPGPASSWEAEGVSVRLADASKGCRLELSAPQESIRLVKLRWSRPAASRLLVLGDHWERAYGDAEWRGLVPERVLPWYFLAHDGVRTEGFGVKTGAAALVYWQADADGITLTADVTSGSTGVSLGARTLAVAELVHDAGREGDSPYIAARRFCEMLCDHPRLPDHPVYGGNNWYYAYGNSSQEKMLEDSRFMASLSDHPTNRPYMVIDDGWQAVSGGGACNGGPWIGNSRFPDMERLAGDMKSAGVRPGLWCRPLLTAEDVPAEWIRYSTGGGHVLDPSQPGVLEHIAEAVQRMTGWGYELLKHDFTTFDIMGQWGFGMKSRPHGLPQPMLDNTRTTAEITSELYRVIADSAGKAILIGCNTIGHLSAGHFHIQRTGDDTSGKMWERTRYMGVNTLAFRMAQHDTFFSHDADCLGLTADIPWELNRQWLRLLAGSGTPLFVSADPAIVTREQEEELRAAFSRASRPQAPAEPLDWLDTTCPRRWLLDGQEAEFDWNHVSAELLEEKDSVWWL